MKIAIIGNGRMGKLISKIAKKKRHQITVIASSNNPAKNLDLSSVNVAIDFSTPNTAFENISHSIKSGVPVISGTTGWTDKLHVIKDLCKKNNGAFLYSSNFSLGMNLFFKLNKQLADLMINQSYKVQAHEIHHEKKLDSPSGTAKKLVKDLEGILDDECKITFERVKDLSGIHKITYTSINDEIKIKHIAKNRNGFAIGALSAAEWIIDKKGFFTLDDMLRNKTLNNNY